MDSQPRPKPKWDCDLSYPEFHDDLIEGLSGITDPELGFSIIELGLVRNISIVDDKVKVLMILTTPFCPYGPSMLEATRAKVAEILNLDTEIELGPEIWDLTMMDEDLMDKDWGLFP